MSKELYEAIDNLWANLAYTNYTKNYSTRDRNLLIEAVKHLEFLEKDKCIDIIDNVMSFKNNNENSSEALKCLDEIIRSFDEEHYNKESVEERFYIENHFKDKFEEELNIIKQAILKAQELKSENDALLEENKDLYVELAFSEKQYKELIECNEQYGNVLKIISEKQVDIQLLKDCESRSEYNMVFPYREMYHLTQEEFDLLKSWLDNRKKGK